MTLKIRYEYANVNANYVYIHSESYLGKQITNIVVVLLQAADQLIAVTLWCLSIELIAWESQNTQTCQIQMQSKHIYCHVVQRTTNVSISEILYAHSGFNLNS